MLIPCRSATVRARTDVSLWTVDRDTFNQVLKSSKRVRSIFDEFASDVDGGERLMTLHDFIASLSKASPSKEKRALLQRLFSIVDKDRSGRIRSCPFGCVI
jgi:Ca2+-binding EF-hand superfamily protein